MGACLGNTGDAGLIHDIKDSAEIEHRLADAARRIAERADALAERIHKGQSKDTHHKQLLTPHALQQGHERNS